MLREKIKMNKMPIILALIHWFLLMILQVDRNFFVYTHENTAMMISKAFSLLLLEFLWILVFYLYKGYKAKNFFAMRFLDVFGLYSLLISFLLLLVWPGTWAWDDIWVLSESQYYHVGAWQHFLSSYEQLIFLQLFPSPGGLILVRNLFIALIVAYSVCKIEKTFAIDFRPFHNYWLGTFLKILPFLFPPILIYQLSGYRIGFYVYLELLMVVIMICSIKGTYHWTTFRVIIFSLLVSVCACWRSESIFYVILGILFYGKFRNPTFTRKLRIIGVVLVVLMTGGLTQYQSNKLGNSNYQLISTLCPAVELIRHADLEKDQDALAQISNVVHVDMVRAEPEKRGEAIYWEYKDYKRNYTKQEYREYLKGFLTLCKRYPEVVWNERFLMFKRTSGIKEKSVNNVDGAVAIYNPAKGNSNYRVLESIKTGNKYPVFKRMRERTIKAMGMERNGKVVQPLYSIVWNIIVPILVLLGGFGALLWKRKRQFAVILAFILLKIPAVFASAPSNWFMYYMSFYFFGYTLFVYYILYYLMKRKEKKAHAG